MGHPPQIPLTPQTDERNFPRHNPQTKDPNGSGYPYPKMLTRPCTRQDRDDWVAKHRRIDQNTRQDYWEESPPRIGAPLPIPATQELVDKAKAACIGEPVIVDTKEDEVEVLKILGLGEDEPAPKTVMIPLARPATQAAPAPVKRRRRRVAAQPQGPQGGWVEED